MCRPILIFTEIKSRGISREPVHILAVGRVKENSMPRGSKTAYTDKQKRKAEHIEERYEDRGVSKKEAERRAWATVNKQDGGGKAKR